MKAVNNLLALALMAAFATPALAEGIDVKVTGTIAPVACTPTLSGGGVIDYGKISPTLLSPTEYNLLDEKQLDFAINCEAPVKLAVKATNGRPGPLAGATEGAGGFGSAPAKGLFGDDGSTASAGLGLAGDAKIGGFAVRLTAGTMTADGLAVDSIQRTVGGAWAKTSYGILFSSNLVRESSWAKTGSIAPLAFTTLAGKLGVHAYINKTSELDLTQPITLDGLTTIELVYL